VATRDDLAAIADNRARDRRDGLLGRALLPHGLRGRHASIGALPGMLDHTLAAYTFSKSYSMSGWRIGFAVAHPEVVEAIGKLINTSASCSPPFVQWAAKAALEHDAAARDEAMLLFRRKVERLAAGLARIEGIEGRAAGGHLLRLPRRPRRSANRLGLHLARPGASTCSRTPTTPSASPAWAASPFGEGRPRLPPLQLRRGRRADRPGPGPSCRGPGAHRPRRAVPPPLPPVRPG